MTAIFDYPLTLTLESSRTSFAVLVDLKNVGTAFGISLLCILCTSCVRYKYFKVKDRHLGFSTSGSFPFGRFGRTLLQLFPLDIWTPKHK